MRIELNKNDKTKLIKLLEVKEENIAIASMLNDLCFSLDQFNELKDIDKNDISSKCKELFLDYFELDDNNGDNIRITDQYLSNAFSLSDINEYENNPYKKSLKIKEILQNGYKLHYLSYPSYSFFPLDDIKVDEEDYYREYTSISYFNNEYKYLTLSKNNNIWMCVTPNEINTMKPHIKKARGNIITFGLGLGYYIYMASMKNEVKKITIIERDEYIINLFKEHLLPLFPYKEKIEIIKEDALSYITKTKLIQYDYAFFDLWHNAEDGLPLYIKIKELDIRCDTSFWIEESLIAMYRRCLLTVIEESLNHYSDDDYRRSKNAIDKVINQIYFKTKNLSFNTYKDIHNFLSKDNILKLISK